MDRFGVQLALEAVADARAAWAKAQTSFNANVDMVMSRLLHEAAANRMSVEQISKAIGMTPKQVRERMRRCGLDPKMGSIMLSREAAIALESNSALLGIDPLQMDLMSPLAYLPMGGDLKKFLETKPVTVIPDSENPEKCPSCGKPRSAHTGGFDIFCREGERKNGFPDTIWPHEEPSGCDCYPGGFSPETYEGPQETCPVHGRAHHDAEKNAL